MQVANKIKTQQRSNIVPIIKAIAKQQARLDKWERQDAKTWARVLQDYEAQLHQLDVATQQVCGVQAKLAKGRQVAEARTLQMQQAFDTVQCCNVMFRWRLVHCDMTTAL
ncbi:hypothetical protein OAN61_01105 [bacterium]|nr:hypothetical protein [bacterium]